jgi:hypothetical protein
MPALSPTVAPQNTPAPKRITWATSVTGGIAPIVTYISATINPGQRRHRVTKAQTEAADRAAFLRASITIHPGITSITWSKRRSSTRRSNCRKRGQHLPIHHARRSHNQPHIIIKHHMDCFTTNIAVALHTSHTVIAATTGETFERAQFIRGVDSEQWLYSTANKFRRLTKGILPHIPSGTETMAYLHHDALPNGRKATYARFVATEQPHKTEKKCVRLTVWGNLIDYPDKLITPSADLSTIKILLNSVISTPNARFATFDLKDFRDASYLSEATARSRADGIFFLSKCPSDPSKPPAPTAIPPPQNGDIHIISSIMRNVMAFAMEAGLGALFHNARDGIPIRNTLTEMGHEQAATPIQTDNACAAGVTNESVKQRRSKNHRQFLLDTRWHQTRPIHHTLS